MLAAVCGWLRRESVIGFARSRRAGCGAIENPACAGNLRAARNVGIDLLGGGDGSNDETSTVRFDFRRKHSQDLFRNRPGFGIIAIIPINCEIFRRVSQRHMRPSGDRSRKNLSSRTSSSPTIV